VRPREAGKQILAKLEELKVEPAAQKTGE